MKGIGDFFASQEEPNQSCFIALRDIISAQDIHITSSLKYGMPFPSYKGKMFCYLWLHKKYKLPYLGLVEGGRFEEPFLLQEKRSRMKIMLIDPTLDLPLLEIRNILRKALDLYKKGVINCDDSIQ